MREKAASVIQYDMIQRIMLNIIIARESSSRKEYYIYRKNQIKVHRHDEKLPWPAKFIKVKLPEY